MLVLFTGLFLTLLYSGGLPVPVCVLAVVDSGGEYQASRLSGSVLVKGQVVWLAQKWPAVYIRQTFVYTGSLKARACLGVYVLTPHCHASCRRCGMVLTVSAVSHTAG